MKNGNKKKQSAPRPLKENLIRFAADSANNQSIANQSVIQIADTLTDAAEVQKMLSCFSELQNSAALVDNQKKALYSIFRKGRVLKRLRSIVDSNPEVSSLLEPYGCTIIPFSAGNQDADTCGNPNMEKQEGNSKPTNVHEYDNTLSALEERCAILQQQNDELLRKLNDCDREMQELLDEKDQVEDQLAQTMPFKQQAETLASDLAAKKREIAKLKKEKDDSEAKGASAKLADVLYEIGPVLDNLMLCTEPEELQTLLQDVIDALGNAGAEVIGQIGEETRYDPMLHQYIGQGKISGDTPVIIENVGFIVGERVIHPAKVKAKEVQ